MKRLIILIIVVGLLATAALGAWTYYDLHKPVAHTKTGQYIEIPKGSSPSAIIKKLTAEGILKNEWPLKLYLKGSGKGRILMIGHLDTVFEPGTAAKRPFRIVGDRAGLFGRGLQVGVRRARR